VVGGLPENLDAYPHPGESQPRLTGTYLQAWSNTEHLRAWYQAFLGVRPALDAARITLAPRLPEAAGDVDFEARVGSGSLRGVYTQLATGRRYHWLLHGLDANVTVDLPGLAPQSLAMRAGDQLVVDESGNSARAALHSADGRLRQSLRFKASVERKSRQDAWDRMFAGVGFATPRSIDRLAIRCSEPLAR
jgi:hypothetical protein